MELSIRSTRQHEQYAPSLYGHVARISQPFPLPRRPCPRVLRTAAWFGVLLVRVVGRAGSVGAATVAARAGPMHVLVIRCRCVHVWLSRPVRFSVPLFLGAPCQKPSRQAVVVPWCGIVLWQDLSAAAPACCGRASLAADRIVCAACYHAGRTGRGPLASSSVPKTRATAPSRARGAPCLAWLGSPGSVGTLAAAVCGEFPALLSVIL